MSHSTSSKPPLPSSELDWDEVGDEAKELFRSLLRIDTTNPGQPERPAADFLAEQLEEDGLEPWIVESAPGRANLVVRLPATVDEPVGGPLLLAGHTDVVPARAEDWTHPPFDGVEADGYIWGRGAVDMKNMVAMSVMVAKLMARHGVERNRDLIVAAVADEEAGCTHGSRFLVDEHPDRIDAEFMLGEVGGFWQTISGRTYVPIMVAEKGQVHLKLTARGPSAHGSIPHEDNALVRLARAIARLGSTRLPYHLTPVMEDFIRTLQRTQPLVNRVGLEGLLNGRTAGPVIDRLLPDKSVARNFGALLHNTVSPTMSDVGTRLNVVPPEATCHLDGRILPGFEAEDLEREVEACIDDPRVEVEVLDECPPTLAEPVQSDLLDTIVGTVLAHSPEVEPAPYMIPGFTDAREFSRLGMRCYGFSPLKLAADSELTFSEMFHGVDERVPVDGFVWGQRVLFDTVVRFLRANPTSSSEASAQ
jgi:acetylornithine deacetylase/succinyl-diaminopimelate desuccinylase-like protein